MLGAGSGPTLLIARRAGSKRRMPEVGPRGVDPPSIRICPPLSSPGLADLPYPLLYYTVEQTAPPVTGKTLPLPEPTRDGRVLAEASRERYGTKRRDVDAAIWARLQPLPPSYRIGRVSREVSV